jgi:trypsin
MSTVAKVAQQHEEDEDTPMSFVMLGTSNTVNTPEDQDKDDQEEPATNLTPYTRIGGSSSFLAPDNRYPYMASLQMEGASPSSGKFDYHMCGGFLIAPDLIMTSAHCAEYSPPGTDETFQAFNGIEVGRNNLGKEVAYDAHSLQTYHLDYENLIPEKLIKHPKYNPSTYEHDLMIVKIFGKSRYDPVKIDRDAVGGGEEITVLGWGATSANENKKYSDELREADVLVMDNESCRNTEVQVTNPTTGESVTTSLSNNVYNDMMCAMARNRFICHGDGGGPAIKRGNSPQEDRVAGIVSWGYGCVDPNYPAIMTRTADHEQWIRTIVCKESTDPPSEYGCGGGMTLNSASSTARQTVTLKLKLDKMAVETGFVILTSPQPSVVAQRVPGYYKIRENEIVEEQMDLPSNQCYKLILLDSFGDGFCCDIGGGSGALYLGTDTGYYTGRLLVEVKGSFEYDSSGEFCLDASSMIVGTDEGKSAVVNSPSGSSSSSGSGSSSNVSSSNNVSSGSNSNGSSGSNSSQGSSSNSGSGWSGPAASAAFEYCNKFCIDNAKALNCGSYTCYHSGASATDSQGSGVGGNGGSGGGTSDKDESDPHGHASNPDEYFLTVQFKFDDHPQDVSWVLYDLTANEVRMFVDFDVYKEEDFANQKLEVVVNVEGPEAGEKQYAFTVYDKASDGLCCDNGKGWYKLFLGNVEDNMKLLGDADYEFSSSYYFTLFEEEEGDMTMNNSSAQDEESTSDPTKPPTVSPTAKPSDKPTPGPTARPSVSPTQSPSHSPTTPKPTFPWEVKRSELMEEIGARWNTASVTPPDGKFNDVGGDPRSFDFTADLQRSDGSSSFRIWAVLSALLLTCFALL